MNDPRPWPATGDGLEVLQRVLVDFDEGDVLPGGFRMRRPRQPPVVGLELEGVEWVEDRPIAKYSTNHRVSQQDQNGAATAPISRPASTRRLIR